jgi:antitoxin component of RelBE/YafQ-DinJ toxin-antitoxin module
MPLSGNLETFHITNVLQLLHNDQKTGILTVTWKDETIKVYIREGHIIYATKSHEKNRLGDLLIKNGIITEKQLKECLNASKKQNIPLGKVVVEKGYTTAGSLGKIIFKQAENAIYDLFFWEKGEFEYTDKTFSTQRMVVKKINIMSTILEAARRIDEMPVLKKQIPREDMVFQASDSVKKDNKIKLNPDEWSVLALVDGKLTVKQIIAESINDSFTVYQILNSLISYGSIKKKETLTPLQQATDAFNKLKEVDSKMIRRELDNMGLSRSSILRLIVTRIARDSFSPEELLELVDVEAKKIVNPEDKQLITGLMKQNQVPFLENIFCLLHEKTEEDQG